MDIDIDTERLIHEIKIRPSLWNPRCPEHSRRIVKTRHWNEVLDIFGGGVIGENREILLENIQRKWKNLRDSFVKSYKIATSESLIHRRRRPYLFYKQLLFLSDVARSKPSSPELRTMKRPDEDYRTAFINDFRTVEKQPNEDVFKTEDNDYVSRELLGVLNKYLEKSKLADDEDRLFFLSLVNEFKKIPEENRMDAKIEILNAIKKFQ